MVAASSQKSRGRNSSRSRSLGSRLPVRSGSVMIFLSSGGGASRQEPLVFTPMPKMARPLGVALAALVLQLSGPGDYKATATLLLDPTAGRMRAPHLFTWHRGAPR